VERVARRAATTLAGTSATPPGAPGRTVRTRTGAAAARSGAASARAASGARAAPARRNAAQLNTWKLARGQLAQRYAYRTSTSRFGGRELERERQALDLPADVDDGRGFRGRQQRRLDAPGLDHAGEGGAELGVGEAGPRRGDPGLGLGALGLGALELARRGGPLAGELGDAALGQNNANRTWRETMRSLRRAPVVEEILDGDLAAVGEDAAVDDAVAALADHVLGGEAGGGLLQLPERVPVAPPPVRPPHPHPHRRLRRRRQVGRHRAHLTVGVRHHAAALAGLDVHALRPVHGGATQRVTVDHRAADTPNFYRIFYAVFPSLRFAPPDLLQAAVIVIVVSPADWW